MAIVRVSKSPRNPTKAPPISGMPEDIPRDRWGRPKIMPPGGKGSGSYYTRASTLGGTLEDQYNLGQWKMRMVAWGMGRRPDLVLAATAAASEDKDTLGEIVDRAMEAAETSAAATVGTALHAITELVDRGEVIPDVGPVHEPMLVAYRELIVHFRVHAIEQFVVCDSIKTAGTFDRILSPVGVLTAPDGTIYTEDDRLVGDLKTSGSADYFGIKFAVQLAVYSRGIPYRHGKGRLAWPDGIAPDQRWGLVIHAPSGGASADLYWVDLTSGWEAAQLACTVREWRRRKDLVVPADLPELVDPVPALGIRIRNASSLEGLEALYDAHEDVWSDEHTALANQRLAELEAEKAQRYQRELAEARAEEQALEDE
jgi:hypothetical protein